MSDDETTMPCPMRRLGASRMPAWAVAEFAGAEACAALCLASREWDAAVASSPLWAARVRRAAPLTFHALCAARHPMAAAETVARIPFDRTDESTTTDPKPADVEPKQTPSSTEGVPSEFGLQFAPASSFEHPRERELLRTADDLRRVFVDYAGNSALPSVVHAKVHTPLFVSVSAAAALELAAAPPAFDAAVDGGRTVEDRAAAAAFLKGSAAAVAAALEKGNWRAVAALLSSLRDLPFGPCMEKKKKKAVSPPPQADDDAENAPPDGDTEAPVEKKTKSSAFYPTAGTPKSTAIVEAIAGSAPNAGAHVGVADQESAAQYALKTTPMSVGYCRTEKEMLKMRLGKCGTASEGKGGLASLFKKKQVERRVLMIGVENTGKTTFLYQLKLGEIVTTVPTIGFNVESCGSPRKKFNLTMWDVGGQDKIRPLWRHYFDGTDGLVFFVNSTSLFHVYEGRENFKKVAVELIGSTNAMKIALTIICSKQDLPGAVLPEAVAAAFMSITLAELSTVPDNVPEAGDKRAKFFRENPGGPLLSQFGTWRFVGCNALSRTSCAGVVGIIEDDLETLYKQ